MIHANRTRCASLNAAWGAGGGGGGGGRKYILIENNEGTILIEIYLRGPAGNQW